MAFDATNNSPPSRSRFKKSVSLQDWWLTKPQADDDSNTIGVSGLTRTSQRSRAERCFTSAPILKVYDIFELETVDGISIILQGYINKEKTLESGFSSEVFDHFVIGFPPYWEEFSTSCSKGGSAGESVSRGNEDRNDSMGNLHGKLLHHDSYTMDSGVEDSEDNFLIKKASTVCNACSSLDIPHERIMEAGHEVLCGRSFTSEFKDMNVVGNKPLLKSLKMDGFKFVKGSCSRRTTRSMTKMGSTSSNNDSAQGSLSHGISNMHKVTFVDTENLEIASKGKNDASKPEQNDQYVVGDQSTHAINESHTDSVTSVPFITSKKGSHNKKRDTSGGVDVPDQEAVAARQGIASITPSKSKRKLTFESEMAGRQHATSPKYTSPRTAKKGSIERCFSANLLSPESLSGGKRSRSGRVLLPSLEFWRNQTVVYDVGLDRQVTGVLDMAQSSKVDTSKDSKSSIKKDKKACRR